MKLKLLFIISAFLYLVSPKSVESSNVTKSATGNQEEPVFSIITGAGINGGPHIRAFNSSGEAETEPNKLFAYAETFRGGVFVASGDIDGDDLDEIITAPRTGGGPQVRFFEKDGSAKAWQIWPFHPDSRTGVSIAAADVNNDNKAEIGVIPASNDQARVKVYQFDEARTILGEWTAFGTVECGASLAMGDVNNDGEVEVIIGAGEGGGPQVRIFKSDGTFVSQFFAFEAGYRGGIDLSVGDTDGDGQSNNIVVSKKQDISTVKIFNFDNLNSPVGIFNAFANAPVGTFVDVGDIDQNGYDDIITGATNGGGPQVRAFDYRGEQIGNLSFFAYDTQFRGGVDVAAGVFSWNNIQPIIIYGDSRTGHTTHQNIVDDIIELTPFAVFHTGDLVDNGLDPDQWGVFNEITAELMPITKFYPALGNHELNSQLYFDNFDLPNNERWYSVEIKNIHLTILDSNYETSVGSEQYNWLGTDLQSIDDNIKFTIAIFHHPPFSTGPHTEDELGLRETFVPLLEQYGVNLVFSGHDHTYERSLYNNTYYIVAGGGGAPLYDQARTSPYSQVFAKAYHFCKLSIDGDELTMEVFDIDSNLIDQLIITNN